MGPARARPLSPAIEWPREMWSWRGLAFGVWEGRVSMSPVFKPANSYSAFEKKVRSSRRYILDEEDQQFPPLYYTRPRQLVGP